MPARLLTQVFKHKSAPACGDKSAAEKYLAQFKEAVDDDLNVPLALGILWTMIKEKPCREIYEAVLEFDKVLGLSLDKAQPAQEEQEDVPAEILELCEQRKAAKAARDWAKADALRARISELGYGVTDTKEGYKVAKL